MEAVPQEWQEMDQLQRAFFVYCVERLRQQSDESGEREA
jgi:hypothetical protein